jgi:dihydrofolate synthase/folylpolyglutamate synthase
MSLEFFYLYDKLTVSSIYFKILFMVRMPHWPKQFGANFIDLGLERIKNLLNRLGNPEKNIPPVIHVAGTNGKGSTIAFLKAIFNAAGYSVHQYTSPHLIRFNERIVISNNEITDEQLYEVIEECRLKSEDLNLTFFEATTAAAFLAFSKFSADVVLLETGLGGRYDATNVMENILMSIITPISLDHTEFLGETSLKIATEKAGIIKNNSHSIISWQEKEVLNYLIDECKKIGAKSFACQKDWSFEKTENGFKVIDFSIGEEIDFPMPNLKGIHQIINASTAICATQKLRKFFNITQEHLKQGITSACWPARMQKIQNGTLLSLLPKNSEVWLDGAHNTAGAEMIAATLTTFSKMPTFLINGMTRDRDIEGFLLPFMNVVEYVFAVPVEWEPKSENPNKIKISAEKLGMKSIECISLSEAIDLCAIKSQSKAIRIIICGSLYLAGDVENNSKSMY